MRQGQAREGKVDHLCTAVTGPGATALAEREDIQLVHKTRVLKDGRGDGGKKERERLSSRAPGFQRLWSSGLGSAHILRGRPLVCHSESPTPALHALACLTCLHELLRRAPFKGLALLLQD